jgi:hypothetical protein
VENQVRACTEENQVNSQDKDARGGGEFDDEYTGAQNIPQPLELPMFDYLWLDNNCTENSSMGIDDLLDVLSGYVFKNGQYIHVDDGNPVVFSAGKIPEESLYDDNKALREAELLDIAWNSNLVPGEMVAENLVEDDMEVNTCEAELDEFLSKKTEFPYNERETHEYYPWGSKMVSNALYRI